MNLSLFEKKIGITFKNEDYLKEALTHRSYLNENASWRTPHNERLEFLGDAVLELVITEALFKKFPSFPEGQLTVLRASLVNYQILAVVAGEVGLDEYVRMSKGERGDSKRAKEVILANAFEALIGAIYLDQGIDTARVFILGAVFKNVDDILKSGSYRDPKSELQEMVQEQKRITPTYEVLEESGPAHERIFKIAVLFGNERIAEGEGASKQDAEINAAREALKKIAG